VSSAAFTFCRGTCWDAALLRERFVEYRVLGVAAWPQQSDQPCQPEHRGARDVDWAIRTRTFALDTDASNLKGHIDTRRYRRRNVQAEAEKAKGASKRFAPEERLVPKASVIRLSQMLEQQKTLTLSWCHAGPHAHPIALAAMDLNKHVYVQKPLCWSWTKRANWRSAPRKQAATQMGNQGHSLDAARTAVETSGPARSRSSRIHVWTDRPWDSGPRRAAPQAATKEALDALPWTRGVDARLAAAMAAIPFRTRYRGFIPRCGTPCRITDLSPIQLARLDRLGLRRDRRHGPHLLDVTMWSLKLGLPTSIETVSSPFNGVPTDRHDDLL